MSILDDITEKLAEQSQKLLGDNLVGVYLHGSAVMDCFNEKTSDIDLLVVVHTVIPDEIKLQYMAMITDLNASAPKKGIELSIVRKDVCRPFIYPTPFELHFSIAHLKWYEENPMDYVKKMKGTDKDLAAHFTIIWHRGKCLCGKEIKDVFEKIDRRFYFDSILNDIEDAENEIITNPVYIILNLCRVLAYKKEELILSKKEGGEWGLSHIPAEYQSLLLQALEEYTTNKSKKWSHDHMKKYATYMMEQLSHHTIP